MAYPQGPYEPPPPYNPTPDNIPQGPGWGPQAPPPAPGWAPPPQVPNQGATVFNPDAQGYVKQGSTYYAAGPNLPPGGYYPAPTQPPPPAGGYYPQQQGYGQPMPGYYPGQPVTTAPGYYGAAGYPTAATTTVVHERQSDNRCDDLTKCCLGTCCLTWLCCWLTD